MTQPTNQQTSASQTAKDCCVTPTYFLNLIGWFFVICSVSPVDSRGRFSISRLPRESHKRQEMIHHRRVPGGGHPHQSTSAGASNINSSLIGRSQATSGSDQGTLEAALTATGFDGLVGDNTPAGAGALHSGARRGLPWGKGDGLRRKMAIVAAIGADLVRLRRNRSPRVWLDVCFSIDRLFPLSLVRHLAHMHPECYSTAWCLGSCSSRRLGDLLCACAP